MHEMPVPPRCASRHQRRARARSLHTLTTTPPLLRPCYYRALPRRSDRRQNAELFTLTYGAMVTQLVKDYEDIEEVNAQLDKMGYNIGVRLIDEFLAKSSVSRCRSFKDTAESVAKVAFKMFLGVTAEVVGWNADFTACSLVLPDNPLAEFAELPPTLSGLYYSNVLCGVVRGALEMVQMRVDVRFIQDVLHGDAQNEIRIELKGMIDEGAGEDYDDE